MKMTTTEPPMMDRDHFVVKARTLLAALQGIAKIYSNSRFHITEIQYDKMQLSKQETRQARC